MCRCGRLQSRQMAPQSSAAVMMPPSGDGIYRISEHSEASRARAACKFMTWQKALLFLFAPENGILQCTMAGVVSRWWRGEYQVRWNKTHQMPLWDTIVIAGCSVQFQTAPSASRPQTLLPYQ